MKTRNERIIEKHQQLIEKLQALDVVAIELKEASKLNGSIPYSEFQSKMSEIRKKEKEIMSEYRDKLHNLTVASRHDFNNYRSSYHDCLIVYQGIEMDVTFDYTPPQKEIRYPNDIAQEGFPECFEITEITIGGQNAWDLLEAYLPDIEKVLIETLSAY